MRAKNEYQFVVDMTIAPHRVTTTNNIYCLPE
jgi:hypothetical protein